MPGKGFPSCTGVKGHKGFPLSVVPLNGGKGFPASSRLAQLSRRRRQTLWWQGFPDVGIVLYRNGSVSAAG
jgi:hypothetical protein